MQERAFVLHHLRELAPEKVLEADLNFVSGQAIRKIR
jgi:7,8-dihydro-6-hydroxymethylpterin-pyrophosphokinase